MFKKMGFFYTHVGDSFFFLFFLICWSWDRPIVMRFIYTYFERIPFVSFDRTIPEWIPPECSSLKRVCSLEVWTVKEWFFFSCTGHVYLEILNHWIVKSRWINFACSLKYLIWGLFVKNKKSKYFNILKKCKSWFSYICCYIFATPDFFFPLMYFSVPMPLLSVETFSIFGGLMVILDISVYLTRFHPLMTLFRRWYCPPCFPPARLICPREEGNCLKSCLFSLTALPVDHVWTRSDLGMFQPQKKTNKKNKSKVKNLW